jgi:FkbM family methyltransferase
MPEVRCHALLHDMNFSLISPHITPKFVLDIGARLGDWAKEAKAVWPDADFFLIEGNRECRTALEESGFRHTIELLSDSEKSVDFYTLRDCPTATGASYYRENTPFFEGDKAVVTKLPTRTLDFYFEINHEQPRPWLLKIDCQGSELDILKGGQKVLAQSDAVILELSRVEYNIGAPLCDEVDAWMQEHGFKAVDVVGDIVHVIDRHVVQSDVLYLRK